MLCAWPLSLSLCCSAAQVFDDIAFFYLAMAVVATAVLPWSAFKLGFAIHAALQKPQLIPLTRIQKLKQQQNIAAKAAAAAAASSSGAVTVQPAGSPSASSSSSSSSFLDKSNAAASGLTQESLRPSKPWLSCGNVTLALLWVLFFYMLLQIPSFSQENLASFKPYDILGIDSKANDDEIKKVSSAANARQQQQQRAHTEATASTLFPRR